MLTLTYGQLRDDAFGRGIAKMSNYSGYKSPAAAVNVAKVYKRLIEENKIYDETRQKLIDQYAKKTEDGKLEPHDGREGTFVIKDDAESVAGWTKGLEELNAVSFEIDRPRIKLDDLTGVGLSPVEISACEPLLLVVEAVE